MEHGSWFRHGVRGSVSHLSLSAVWSSSCCHLPGKTFLFTLTPFWVAVDDKIACAGMETSPADKDGQASPNRSRGMPRPLVAEKPLLETPEKATLFTKGTGQTQAILAVKSVLFASDNALVPHEEECCRDAWCQPTIVLPV